MDIERFRAVASEIQAERFFQEKAASARVNPVALISVSRAADAEDPELLKIAAQFCPEAPLEFYEKRLFGKFKTAEPGPPPGVSLEAWDKILQGGDAKKTKSLP